MHQIDRIMGSPVRVSLLVYSDKYIDRNGNDLLMQAHLSWKSDELPCDHLNLDITAP